MNRDATGLDTMRGGGLVMALLALLVSLAVPPGFMPGRSPGSPLVICTGHGAMSMAGAPHDRPAKPGHSGDHRQTCPFAGHGVASPPPVAVALAATRLDRERPLDPTFRDLAPGLGLAAPPPPSRGPPTLL